MHLNRRTAITVSAATSLSFARAVQAAETPFQFRYALASCIYGYTSLAEILPEAKKIGARNPKVMAEVLLRTSS